MLSYHIFVVLVIQLVLLYMGGPILLQRGPEGTSKDQKGPEGIRWDQEGPGGPGGTRKDQRGPEGTKWDQEVPAGKEGVNTTIGGKL